MVKFPKGMQVENLSIRSSSNKILGFAGFFKIGTLPADAHSNWIVQRISKVRITMRHHRTSSGRVRASAAASTLAVALVMPLLLGISSAMQPELPTPATAHIGAGVSAGQV
jgi:hypothetical protein